MVLQRLPRPKPSEPKAAANYRVAQSLRDKFNFACDKRRTTPTLQITGFMEDFVAAYEKENGPIKLPAPGQDS